MAPVWVNPSIDREEGEIELHSRLLGIDQDLLRSTLQQGHLETLSDDLWSQLDNTWSWDITKSNHYKWAEERDRDAQRIDLGFEQGHEIPAPIILCREGELPYLIAGNTRLSAAFIHKVRPMVWVARM